MSGPGLTDQATHGDDRVGEVEERLDDDLAAFVAALQPVEAAAGPHPGQARRTRPAARRHHRAPRLRLHDTAAAVKEKAGLVAAYLDRCFVQQVLRDQPTSRDRKDEDVRELVPLLKRCATADDVRRLLSERLTGGDFAEVLTFGLRGNNRANVHYLLARLTDHVERGCGGADRVEELLSTERNFQIEHLFANHPERLAQELPDAAEFRALRERLGALVLLPASENASYRDKPLPDKLPFYARQNHLTAVLSSPAHSTNNPILRRFVKEEGLEDAFHRGSRYGATVDPDGAERLASGDRY